MKRQMENIKNILDIYNIDAILIKSKTSKKYLNSLRGSGVELLITRKESFMILDEKYLNEGLEKEDVFKIIENTPSKSKKTNFQVVEEIFKKLNYKKLGIEGSAYSINEYEKLKKHSFSVVLIEEDINKARIIKEKNEIEIIKEGCKITDNIFLDVLKHIKIGITENEINGWIHYYALKAGATGLSFDPVITSGKRTAFPHGRPTDKKVALGDPIMIDFGIEYKNYQTDMTRMVFMGNPSEEIVEIYNIVKEAQELGIESIESGIKGNEVDKIVRDLINEYGYGEYYNHGLGHGIGIGDGCEYPFLNRSSETLLDENMIMSCEPGIYINGVGGVRIEDDVLIKDGRGISLTNTTKEMIILEG